jgi:DedD protein
VSGRPGGSRLRLVFGVAGLLLLAVPGFVLGLLAGVVWREPELVASHLVGGTREVAAAAGGAPPGAPPRAATSDVAAAPPARPAAAPVAPAGVPAAAPAVAPPGKREPARAAAASPAGGARLEIQVGAFGDAASAEKLAGAHRRKGLPAFVSPATGDAGARWRVRVGPIASREDADRTAARLKAEERLPTWVVEEGRS